MTTPPRIAIDYTPAYEKAGIGRLVREMIGAYGRLPSSISDDVRLFVAGAGSNSFPQLPNRQFTWHTTALSAEWLIRLWYRAHLPLPIETFVGRVDLFHATNFMLPPVLPGTRTLLTVHDLSFARVPETANASLMALLNRVVPQSVRRATHIAADSEATRQDLIALYNTPPEKITVIYSGVEGRFHPQPDRAAQAAVRARYEIDERPYILAVGTVQPRKNYGRLIQAAAELRRRGHDIQVIFAGGKGWLDDPIYASMEASGMKGHVRFIGFARDEDLPALYSAAALTAMPSLYEGFGLPVLEAMACGSPVITSDISSLPEVAGDAALLIQPTDVGAIADAAQRVLTEPALRASMIDKGLRQATRFTWEGAAVQLDALYAQVLGKKV
ncbi:MAG: glycosyltransferase family 4 protein [Pleurocapsa minor GSE-CHR-MK-17-07R]|nr:glycosyltransferase family 4 protein [Pleurocapsa minor GSE-CHR-MK 17-07R]